MQFKVESRRVGDIVVVRCEGRLIAGDECNSLQGHVLDAMIFDRNFILNLSQVPFVDSSGLGLLVRLMGRAKAAHGNLKLCGVVPQVMTVLEVTNLHRLLEAHPTEDEAITDFYRNRPASAATKGSTRVLCVHTSSDVLAYLREVLHADGYDALTANNLLDGKVLLAATRPAVVVVSSQLRKLKGTQAADGFHQLASALPVVELNDNFSTEEPAEAARALRAMLGAALGQQGAATAT
jgi:anti-sigma B factor antagonist